MPWFRCWWWCFVVVGGVSLGLHLCRCALEETGIYVIVALAHDCPTCAITRQASPDCYPPELKVQGQRIIQEFAHYPNTLAFSAGNEVNYFTPIGSGGQWNAPCQKKFIRDMREYVASCVEQQRHENATAAVLMRFIPIGLVSADHERDNLAAYYNCQDDPNDPYQRADWYGLNSYVFCDGKADTYDDALGLQLLDASFDSYKYSIPVLLTEFGCLDDSFPAVDGYEGQRNFLQAKWLLDQGSTLRQRFNGGVAFEYSMEYINAHQDSHYPFQTFGKQNYGIGYFEPEGCDDINLACFYHPCLVITHYNAHIRRRSPI